MYTVNHKTVPQTVPWLILALVGAEHLNKALFSLQKFSGPLQYFFKKPKTSPAPFTHFLIRLNFGSFALIFSLRTVLQVKFFRILRRIGKKIANIMRLKNAVRKIMEGTELSESSTCFACRSPGIAVSGAGRENSS